MYKPTWMSFHRSGYYLKIRSSKRKRENQWMKKPLDELEKMYDPEWLQAKVVSQQKGQPHPQDCPVVRCTT